MQYTKGLFRDLNGPVTLWEIGSEIDVVRLEKIKTNTQRRLRCWLILGQKLETLQFLSCKVSSSLSWPTKGDEVCYPAPPWKLEAITQKNPWFVSDAKLHDPVFVSIISLHKNHPLLRSCRLMSDPNSNCLGWWSRLWRRSLLKTFLEVL